MAVVTDAGGAAVGLWQPGLHRGFGVLGEPGTPAWFELHTREYETTLGFYRDAFGWDTHTVSDTPEFHYTTLQHDGEWLAGVMDATGMLVPEVPAHWSVYFGVDDTDAGLARAVERFGRARAGGHAVRAAGRRHRPDRSAVQTRRLQRGDARQHGVLTTSGAVMRQAARTRCGTALLAAPTGAQCTEWRQPGSALALGSLWLL